jgi:uncharacterized protein YggU (UPF0235/DUF167 family)
MYIKVHVVTGAKKELITKKANDLYNVSVREPAERNMANRRVLELVAGELGIPTGKARIVSGHHSPSKILSIIEDK